VFERKALLHRPPMKLELRRANERDLEFLWRLHNAALREYVEKTWGWDEMWQRSKFVEEFDPSVGKIIVVDGTDAGFWRVSDWGTEIHLVSIRLLPEFQNRGIGTTLICDLLEHAEKSVTLQVLKVNPAKSLYERLGFEVFDENETHHKMIKRPSAAG
jgi:ribosomal protein S18 acetylase RimI-like enzyme